MARTDDRLPPALTEVLRKVPLAVVFLDERQIIRPGEGTTVDELRDTARALGRTHHRLKLKGSFRCNGSTAYATWVDDLLGRNLAGPAGALHWPCPVDNVRCLRAVQWRVLEAQLITCQAWFCPPRQVHC
ncbi:MULTISPECIES: DNA/RNA helicase domain-containing protein [Streptomyces]|uniref:DNA/RNA helicase domain-containing protein n=1 Tax=Streptomyces TaxID=1883 RepID=UPI00099EB70E|nr:MULTISPECIES: DNA/RNA helicase domain-containing protein [Streptomyces]MDI5906684.1 DUF2075 domain-containing protein [Streptomyces sp. 12257]